MLGVVAVLGVVAAVSVPGISPLTESTKEAKLERDVRALNAAVRVYQGGGGAIPADATASQVLEQLKSSMSAEAAERQVGVTGGLIDRRLVADVADAAQIPAGDPRAVWDAAGQRFALTTANTAGIVGFSLSDDVALAPRQTDTSRVSAMRFASTDGWVWDYQDGASVASTAIDHLTGSGYGGSNPSGVVFAPTALRLYAPEFSLDGGLYAEEDFALPLNFSNPNPVGTSEVWYSVDGAPYELYTGAPVLVPGEAEVEAFTRSIDPDAWIDSEPASEFYRPDLLRFSGDTQGRFQNPLGDAGMVVEILNSDDAAEMWWGSPYTAGGWFEGNYLRFEGMEFAEVAAFEEFEIGALTYFNSTTYLGTNATGVDLDVLLEILVPNVTAAFTYGFELLSTPNSSGNTADQNADFIWVGNATGGLATEIRGYEYTLNLRFGDLAENGFTTIDTFHVHEGSWATGNVYGTLIRGDRVGDEAPTRLGDLPEGDVL